MAVRIIKKKVEKPRVATQVPKNQGGKARVMTIVNRNTPNKK